MTRLYRSFAGDASPLVGRLAIASGLQVRENDDWRSAMRMLPLSVALGLAILACGGDDGAPTGDNTAYTSDPDKTVVVGGQGGTASGAQSSQGCVQLPSGECADAKQCAAGERRDVIVDTAGKVVAVVCYPADATPPNIDSQGDVNLSKNDNNGVVAVDGANDGVDIAGNVKASGNNVVVYGEGAGVSVIGGNVESTGNNFSVRGVTIKGDVRVQGNNATLVLCVIEGNVLLEGNNNVIADCSILGKVEIKGVNNVLVANEIGGGVALGEDKNTVCDNNVVWTDANANKLFDPGEGGAAITCGGKTK
jgi:hypothetical protein